MEVQVTGVASMSSDLQADDCFSRSSWSGATGANDPSE